MDYDEKFQTFTSFAIKLSKKKSLHQYNQTTNWIQSWCQICTFDKWNQKCPVYLLCVEFLFFHFKKPSLWLITLIMEVKIQKQIIDFFSYFEEFHNLTKKCLKDCQSCAITINKFVVRCKKIKEWVKILRFNVFYCVLKVVNSLLLF